MTTNEQIISDFATQHKERAISFLRRGFPVLSTEDLEDIFQDAIIVLYNKLTNGEKISASLFTYFVGICKLKALEACRLRKSVPMVDEDLCEKDFSDYKIDMLVGLDTDYDELKANMITEFVKMMPEPCGTIFRSCFYDNLSLKAIAAMQNKEVGAVKTSKSRCLKKFRLKFTEMFKSLTDD